MLASRRGWGEDSIYWWEARKRFVGEVSCGYDADGKRVRKKVYGRTKTEVRDKLKKLKEQLDTEQDKDPEPSPEPDVTLSRCAEIWLAEGLDASAQTIRKNRDCLRPVLEAIGGKQLRELSADDVHRALSKMAATRASATVAIAHSALTRAIRHAEARDLVGRNVATLVDTPKGRPGRRSRSLTMDQPAAVIAAASEDRRFGVGYTLAGLDLLLHRIGWSVQVPARQATERDEEQISAWREETWPVIKRRRRTWAPGSVSKTNPARA